MPRNELDVGQPAGPRPRTYRAAVQQLKRCFCLAEHPSLAWFEPLLYFMILVKKGDIFI
jgi:hypothetical protein